METEAKKAENRSNEILIRQLQIGFADIKPDEASRLWVAYEPVWAIGVNGKPITVVYADEKLHVIREELIRLFGETGDGIPVF